MKQSNDKADQPDKHKLQPILQRLQKQIQQLERVLKHTDKDKQSSSETVSNDQSESSSKRLSPSF